MRQTARLSGHPATDTWQCTAYAWWPTCYWAEIRDSAANCAYTDAGGSRKNLNLTIKRDDGNQVPRTRRTRRTDAWARLLFSHPQTSLDFAVTPSTLGKSKRQKLAKSPSFCLLPSDFYSNLLRRSRRRACVNTKPELNASTPTSARSAVELAVRDSSVRVAVAGAGWGLAAWTGGGVAA